MKAGTRWSETANPNALELFLRFHVNWKKRYTKIELPVWQDLQKSLPHHLFVSEPFRKGFLQEVMRRWTTIKTAHRSLIYSAGQKLGASWAEQKEASAELEVLKRYQQECFSWREACKWDDPDEIDPNWTPAHTFLNLLLNEHHEDDLLDEWQQNDATASNEEKVDVRKKMSNFWHRYSKFPFDDIRCLLNLPEFVIGFGDGALGLGEELASNLDIT
jgi:hypothetical protein